MQVRQCVLHDLSESYQLSFWWHVELPRGTTFSRALLTFPWEASSKSSRKVSLRAEIEGKSGQVKEYLDLPLNAVNLESNLLYESHIITEAKITPKSLNFIPDDTVQV